MGWILWTIVGIVVFIIAICIIKKLGSDSGNEEEHKSMWSKIRDACCLRG